MHLFPFLCMQPHTAILIGPSWIDKPSLVVPICWFALLTFAIQGSGFNPQMLENMKGQDMDQARQQLEQYGVSPDEVMQKILSDPELAQVCNQTPALPCPSHA